MEMDTPEACLDRIRDAWNNVDSEAYGAEFEEDATYVAWSGELQHGRQQIVEGHAEIFAKWLDGKKMRVTPIRKVQLSETSAVFTTVGGLGAEDAPYDKFQTFTFVRRGERWFCTAYQNTKMDESAKVMFNAPHL